MEPLAEALGVSVPELMKSEKIEEKNVSVQEEEDVVTDTLQIAVSQKNKWKKIIAVLMFIIGGLLIVMKLLETAISCFIQGSIEDVNEAVGIIGGADGPTAIFVASSGVVSWFSLVIGIVLVIIGVVVIKKR